MATIESEAVEHTFGIDDGLWKNSSATILPMHWATDLHDGLQSGGHTCNFWLVLFELFIDKRWMISNLPKNKPNWLHGLRDCPIYSQSIYSNG